MAMAGLVVQAVSMEEWAGLDFHFTRAIPVEVPAAAPLVRKEPAMVLVVAVAGSVWPAPREAETREPSV